MAAPNQSTERLEGMSEVLDGCATCCDGILKEARAADLPQEKLSRIENAIDVCKEAARELRAR